MYESFHVKNFRCFDNLELNDLARINLIAGKNNTGKTAFLEALFLHAGAYNPSLILNLNAFRGVQGTLVEFRPGGETPWKWLFNQKNDLEYAELEGKNNVGYSLMRLKAVHEAEELQEL